MEAVQQPDKIAITPNNRATSPCRLDLIVSMLKHEQAFFLGEQRDRDCLLYLWVCRSAETNGPTPWCNISGLILCWAKATECRRHCAPKATFIARTRSAEVIVSPSRPRTARRRSLRLAIGMLPLNHVALCGVFDRLARPGVRRGPHTTESIRYTWFGASCLMVVTAV